MLLSFPNQLFFIGGRDRAKFEHCDVPHDWIARVRSRSTDLRISNRGQGESNVRIAIKCPTMCRVRKEHRCSVRVSISERERAKCE